MRIILNSSILRAPRTGIGNYIVELSNALLSTKQLQMFFFDGSSIRAKPIDSQHKQSEFISHFRNIPGAYRIKRTIEQHRFKGSTSALKPALYHEPTLWPLHFDGPTVMTVHDLAHIDFAWTQPAARVREINRELPHALERALRVLVDSQFIANELQQHYEVSPHKIIVAPLAQAHDFQPRRETQLIGTLQRLKLEYRRYLLFVGTLEPRKNLKLALRAHAALPSILRERFPLVIAGGDGWLSQDIEQELNKAAANGHVRRLGYLDRDDVVDILAGAKLFIFPSLYEGFGIPLLEAMASGIPVISSNAASLPEVGGEAVRYVDPNDEHALAQLIIELIEDEAECKRLIAAGIERAKLFSWEQCAAITAETYRAAIANY